MENIKSFNDVTSNLREMYEKHRSDYRKEISILGDKINNLSSSKNENIHEIVDRLNFEKKMYVELLLEVEEKIKELDIVLKKG